MSSSMRVSFTTASTTWSGMSSTVTAPRVPVPAPIERYGWTLPSLDLLSRSHDTSVARDRAEELLEALAELGATCNVESVTIAPQAIRFELAPERGIRMRDFKGIEADLMQRLALPTVRIQAPTPGASTVGIEIPRKDRQTVSLGDVISDAAQPLTAAVGVDMAGDVVTLPISTYPHLLIAGQSGGGKSVLLHSILCSLLASHTPDELEVILIDTKIVESAAYEGVPHVSHIAQDARRAVSVLNGLVGTMEATYRAMGQHGARTLDELNAILIGRGELPIPRRLLVVDEVADLMAQAKNSVETAITRIGAKGRSAGIHIIVATQSPRANVITGALKANLSARIALKTSSALESRIIIDQAGAEDLLGRGDAILDDGQGNTTRFQTAWSSNEDIAGLVNHWKNQI
jgi:S-DNA-T family DNA segregation ATPase FtsK/SpoIIIE